MSKKYLLRLDDACEYINLKNWLRLETILDKHSIKPLVGLIPNNEDPDFMQYSYVPDFWSTHVKRWIDKKWDMALHGYNHVFLTNEGGLNPVNKKSEFAGVDLTIQKNKIRNGVKLLNDKNIFPKYFYAPAHTYDENTLKALYEESEIRLISDTIANDAYHKDGFVFIPQQSGIVRSLPFKITTFCYHPNTMNENDFRRLDLFLENNKSIFHRFDDLEFLKREFNLLDYFYRFIYFKLLR